MKLAESASEVASQARVVGATFARILVPERPIERWDWQLGVVVLVYRDDNFSSSVSFFNIPDSFRNLA
jgi:hypothetical protein